MFALGAAIVGATVLIRNLHVLVTGFVLSNLLVGLETGFAFSLTAAYIRKEHIGMSFGIAYAIGSIGTWLISLLESELLTSAHIVPIACVLFSAAIAFVFIIKGLPTGISSAEAEKPL